ncbi:MAG: hypothetical protein EXS05_12365 [Planctomycetaceae bacterium]|nr:hypothetical protein [Planctomycetaceae bacterium]
MKADPRVFRRPFFIPGRRGPTICGEALYDFQLADFAAMAAAFLAVSHNIEPNPPAIWIERTKGAGKSSDAATALIWLAAFCDRPLTIDVNAGDEEQALELWRAIKRPLKMHQNCWIAEQLDVRATSIVNDRTGTVIDFKTADAKGAHGSLPDVTVIDEVSHTKNWEYLETCLDNATKNPRGVTLCLTNAGNIDSPAFGFRETARESPRWYFSCYTLTAPWLDLEAIAERRRNSPPNRFARLWEGQWLPSTAGDGLSEGDVSAALTMPGPMPLAEVGYTFIGCVDLSHKKDATGFCVLAADHVRGRVRVAFSQKWLPAGGEINFEEVKKAIRVAHRRYGFHLCIFDPWGAQAIAQQLSQFDGIPAMVCPQTPPRQHDQATAVLELFQNRIIDLYNDGPLLMDIRQATIRERNYKLKIESPRSDSGHGDVMSALSIGAPEALWLCRGLPPEAWGGADCEIEIARC